MLLSQEFSSCGPSERSSAFVVAVGVHGHRVYEVLVGYVVLVLQTVVLEEAELVAAFVPYHYVWRFSIVRLADILEQVSLAPISQDFLLLVLVDELVQVALTKAEIWAS